MRQLKIPFLLILFISFVVFISCNSKTREQENIEESEVASTPSDITELARAYADSVLQTMTIEEKAGQCLMPSIFAKSTPASIVKFKRYLEDYHVGGIVFLKGDTKSAKTLSEIAEEISDSTGIGLFLSIDAEWGLGMRLEDASIYPKNGNISKELEDTELFDYGREISKESREAGINMILGPVVDITTNPRNAIGNRSFGDNAELVSDYAVAYAKGLESGGVISVAKHFPGHGGAYNDSHVGIAKIYKGITDMDSIDLKPFRDYVNAGLTGIMAGHIQSMALDPDGNPASVSVDMLTSLLREEMGFKGLILTDAFTMRGATGFSAKEAIAAGADLVLCPSDVEKEYHNLVENLQNGCLDIEVINDRVYRILFTKYLFGLTGGKDHKSP